MRITLEDAEGTGQYACKYEPTTLREKMAGDLAPGALGLVLLSIALPLLQEVVVQHRTCPAPVAPTTKDQIAEAVQRKLSADKVP